MQNFLKVTHKNTKMISNAEQRLTLNKKDTKAMTMPQRLVLLRSHNIFNNLFETFQSDSNVGTTQQKNMLYLIDKSYRFSAGNYMF